MEMETLSVNSAPRFKRRKLAHQRRIANEQDTTTYTSRPRLPNASSNLPASSLGKPEGDADDQTTAANLRDALRNRRRPRDRLRDAARRAEETKLQPIVHPEEPEQNTYSSRFIAQTGQIVDRDDKQMTEYIEARLAEKNYCLYGWPIPKHLEGAINVAALQPKQIAVLEAEDKQVVDIDTDEVGEAAGSNTGKAHRLAVGMGQIQEVDLGLKATTHNIKSRNATKPVPKVRLGRDGRPRPRRGPKRRNSQDLRRDQMVEDLMRDAKLEYFEDEKPIDALPTDNANNDEAMVEKFRQEFLESVESRQQRKPAIPAGGSKGAKEPSKGPKLGGSRSARAAMRLQEEQAAKKKI